MILPLGTPVSVIDSGYSDSAEVRATFRYLSPTSASRPSSRRGSSRSTSFHKTEPRSDVLAVQLFSLKAARVPAR